MHSLVRTLRHWLTPAELRLPKPLPLDEELLKRWEDLLSRKTAGSVENPAAAGAPEGMGALAAEVGTDLWQLRKALGKDAAMSPRTRAKLGHFVNEALETMEQHGIKVKDQTGSLYDSGLSLEVLAFEPRSGLKRDEVIETIKPSVFCRGERVQMGAVIVGTPDKEE